MQPAWTAYRLPWRGTGFNPHPPRRASATRKVQYIQAYTSRFQSSPAPEGECNLKESWGVQDTEETFQSSPAPEGECNRGRRRVGGPGVSILTRPRASATPIFNYLHGTLLRFNPHPPRRASATDLAGDAAGRATVFQSSPAPEGECNLVRLFGYDVRCPFQSSPAPEGECNH